jgi:serine/threonine protein kinase
MANYIGKVIFKIKNNKLLSKVMNQNDINLFYDVNAIINYNLNLYHNNSKIKFKIRNFLGKGTVGCVYLVELITKNSLLENQYYAIKISNKDCIKDLNSEVEMINIFKKENNIEHRSFPICYGLINKTFSMGVLYNFLGYYNLEKLKLNNYYLSFNNSILIIKQIIEQLINFKNIIHCDLKSSNVVYNIVNQNIITTIIDFGLSKNQTNLSNIISTNYITSPESLLSLDIFNICVDYEDNIKYDKHDYYGLFSIILNLFLKETYWNILTNYSKNYLHLSSKIMMKQEYSIIIVYCWYRFFYQNIEDLPNNSFKKLIRLIEKRYGELEDKAIHNFSDFFDFQILNNLDNKKLTPQKIIQLKDFLIKICHFDSNKRESLDKLLKHQFLEPI